VRKFYPIRVTNALPDTEPGAYAMLKIEKYNIITTTVTATMDSDVIQKVTDKLTSMGFCLVSIPQLCFGDYVFECKHLHSGRYFASSNHILSNNFECILEGNNHRVIYRKKIE
jgi:hypothetical protein